VIKPEIPVARYYLWLDDERPLPTGEREKWKHAVNIYDAMKIIREHGMPEFMSLDWYMGGSGQPNGDKFCEWLIGYVYQKYPGYDYSDLAIDCHSSDREMARSMNLMIYNAFDKGILPKNVDLEKGKYE
jgi:hypothetical protein